VGGDDVMCRLEELDFLESAKGPVCVAVLDFSKAYDRLHRT
jgi:hypothetical protein